MGWPQWNTDDPEGEDGRAASIGQMSVAYFVNCSSQHMVVLEIVWLG